MDIDELHLLIERLRFGDPSAADELLRGVQEPLERLTCEMVREFREVGRWFEAADVQQVASVRLMKTLRKVKPVSMDKFLGLARTEVHRVLLDLARQCRRPKWQFTHNTRFAPGGHEDLGWSEVPDRTEDLTDLENWSALQEEVEKLPAKLREAIYLFYYHRWSEKRIGQLFNVSERSIRQWLHSAVVELFRRLKDA
jgi:RNA polymerase sigma-70 factor (ECF subfamily)